MPYFPLPGSITICEINRDLITSTTISDAQAKESYVVTFTTISDAQANETYGKVLGVVFSPIPFQPTISLPNPEQRHEQGYRDALPERGLSALKLVNLLTEADRYRVSWHQHKHILAFISSPNQVIVRDYEDLEVKDPYILTSESQRDIKTLAWRPNGGRTLSVACKGGICIWSASYPGNAAPVRSGIASYLGSLSRGSGVRWTLVDFLRSPDGEQVNALSWSPNGRYLASSSSESSSFTIWDVARGLGTPIRRGIGATSLLKWSPTGDYFFTAKYDGTFYLWETNTWTSERWSSAGGFVTGAQWDPDGRMILISFSESLALGSIHFASRPPSLGDMAMLLSLVIILRCTPVTSGLARIRVLDRQIAWDASGERLALSYKDGNETYIGLIAVYDIWRTPLVSASLIGFIRGPGEEMPKPLAFSFHDKFKQGPLLTVCWSSGWCCTYPLIIRSRLLP